MHQTHAICPACETVAHCHRHGCIPVDGSLHPAMARELRAIEANLQDLHTPAPSAAARAHPATPWSGWDWIDRMRPVALWALLLGGSTASGLCLLLAYTGGSLCAR